MMQLNKRDLITIVVLSVIFFSMATWNLGSTQTPITTTQISASQSFYLDLGTTSNIGSFYILVKDGSFNITLSAGSPGNWQVVTVGSNTYNYYRWNHITINQATQYLKIDANGSASGLIAEVSILDSNNQKLPIISITSLGSENPTLNNLVDEQNKVNLPDTYMDGTYFDEIYFVRTAEQYLNLQSPYEWTHPPLGKLIQATGIVTFGFNPFGWRIMGVLLGTLMIPVMYLLGKRLFGTWIGAFSSAFLMTFDFMHFTMARMGTADTYVVFFLITAQLFFLVYFMNVLKNGWKTPVLPLFLAVIFFILSFSTKWIAMYGAIGMLALLVALRVKDLTKLKGVVNKFVSFFDHPFLLLMGFIAVAVGIYFVIYIPDMLTGRQLYVGDGRGVIDLQFAMYNYHAKLVAEHSFSSAWWSWPFLASMKGYVPLWLDVWYLPNAMKSSIAVLGNPAIWWAGFACIFVTVERAIRRKDLAAVFISSLFFFSWIPYVFISRLTFIYHFYIAVPLLCLAAAYVINRYWDRKLGKVATIAFFVVVVVLFGIFYDIISGAPASATWIEKLRLFPSWYF
jgi:dolichyl-phosphate-mannose-protein mannosyltransferase